MVLADRVHDVLDLDPVHATGCVLIHDLSDHQRTDKRGAVFLTKGGRLLRGEEFFPLRVGVATEAHAVTRCIKVAVGREADWRPVTGFNEVDLVTA